MFVTACGTNDNWDGEGAVIYSGGLEKSVGGYFWWKNIDDPRPLSE